MSWEPPSLRTSADLYRWAVPRRWSLPGSPGNDEPGVLQELTSEPLTDRYGLSMQVYARFPDAVRYYLSIAYQYLGLDPSKTPTDQRLSIGDRGVAGTVPEMVFFGALLEAGFTPTKRGFLDKTPRSFIFQAQLLGGRQPGGSVADFVIFHNARTIAVPIQSVYHGLDNPFGRGGAKSEEDKNQHARLASQGWIDAVITVNDSERGLPLEKGSLAQIKREVRIALELE